MSFEQSSFEESQRFIIEESGGTEEMPIITISCDGIDLKYELDILKQQYRELSSLGLEYDTDTTRLASLKQEQTAVIQSELRKRLEKYSEYFS